MSEHLLPPTAAVILAAGKGSRMNSRTPKLLHKLGDKTIIEHVLDTLSQSQVSDLCFVTGPDEEAFAEIFLRYPDMAIVRQGQTNGTGAAVGSCAELFGESQPSYCHGSIRRQNKTFDHPYTIIILGDTPGLEQQYVDEFLNQLFASGWSLGTIGMSVPNPDGYGRLVLGTGGELTRIVEHKDASDSEKAIQLCSSGIFAGRTALIFDLLQKLDNQNKQGEFYLTQLPELAARQGEKTFVYQVPKWQACIGINTQQQLVDAAAILGSA